MTRLLAFVAAVDLLGLLLRRPRPADPFTAHVVQQKWRKCEEHHFAGFVSHLEPGCGCTPDTP